MLAGHPLSSIDEEVCIVTCEEAQVRGELEALAATTTGRRLLQLALRGIQESGRGLTYGCWVKRDGGVSGCLFQHAYWQGVAEGAFAAEDGPIGRAIREQAGDDAFPIVMRSIRAFDSLGRRRFRRWQRGSLGIPVRRLDEALWRATIERLLVDALAGAGEAPAGVRAEAPRPPVLGAPA